MYINFLNSRIEAALYQEFQEAEYRGVFCFDEEGDQGRK